MYSKIFLIFGTLRLFMMTTNLFVIANVKQLRTGGSFKNFTALFFPNILGVFGVLNSLIFNSFHNRVEFGTVLEGLPNFELGGFEPPPPPPTPPLPIPRYATSTFIPLLFLLSQQKCYVTVVTVSRSLFRRQHHYRRLSPCSLSPTAAIITRFSPGLG